MIIQDNIECDAIEINMGCPRARAERDTFGAFFLSKPELVRDMVSSLVRHCRLPIFAKMRLLATFDESLEFIKMLKTAGISLIAIHGRQRDSKNNGLADLSMIKRIKTQCDNVPIIANGNIANFDDVQKNLLFTKCDGVMSATGLRRNPYLFDGALQNRHCIDACWEYLEFVKVYGVIDSVCINKHILHLEYQCSLKCEKKKRKLGLMIKLLR